MDLSGFVYKCSGGETFDSIARELWQDEACAADLMCANPEYATRQMFLGGERIYVPVVEVAEETEDVTETEPAKAPWKE